MACRDDDDPAARRTARLHVTRGDAPDQTWDDLIVRCVGGSSRCSPTSVELRLGGDGPVLCYRDNLIEVPAADVLQVGVAKDVTGRKA